MSDVPTTPESDAHQGGRTVRRSLVLSFSDRYIRLVLQVTGVAILARLLTPQDYGVFTIGMVVVSMTQALRDFGVISYVMQEKDLTNDRVRTAHGVSLLIGCAAAAIIAGGSGWIADFYANDGVRRVLLVLSGNFLLLPLGSIVLALLRREMNFTALFYINIAASLLNNGVAVALAFLGAGYMSMAWGSLASASGICVLGAMLRPRRYSLLPSLVEWRRIASFGVVASAGILVGEIGQRTPQLVIGRFLGVQALGIYGRASGLVAIFNEVVTTAVAPVAVSAFALQHRSGAGLKHEFLRAVALLTGIALPFFAFVGIMAYPVVHVLYGPTWDEAVPLTRILCVAEAIAVLAALNWYVFQAKGEVRMNLQTQLITQPIAIGLVFIAANFSITVVAYVVVLISLVTIGVSFAFIVRTIRASLIDAVIASAKSLVVTAASAVAPVIVVLTFRIDADHVWLPLVVAAAGAALGWLASAGLFGHELYAELVSVLAHLPVWRRKGPPRDNPAT
jgi:O-antigen/teichoic acid export membrane protein